MNGHASSAAKQHDINLALHPGVRVTASVPNPRGNGARDPGVLLNERVVELHGRLPAEFERHHTFDTYDGQNSALGPDWYALAFAEVEQFNCIQMTAGFPNHNGGWWRSLGVEVREDEDACWRSVRNLKVTPPYNFEDARASRLPYETYALTFEAEAARQVRLIGRPGGSAEFTSLARLGVYLRDLTRWNPAGLPAPPIPLTFQLIAPQIICDFSENFSKLTGLTIDFPLVEFYVDRARFRRYYDDRDEHSGGRVGLWGILGETVGWDAWDRSDDAVPRGNVAPTKPYVRLSFHNTRANAVAPVVVDGVVHGEMCTHFTLLDETFDAAWHREYARTHGIRWQEYELALNTAPRKTMRQLEGAAEILGMFANQIANLAHRNMQLQSELADAQRQSRLRTGSAKELVRAAIDYMQANLEEPLTVAAIAGALAVSPTYLGVLFRRHTGRSPSDHLIELRMARAKEYLAAGTLSVMDICVALGYTPSYFSRLFRRQTGLSPSEFAAKTRPPKP
jgi:AraC-like DNA-binding protein